MFFRLVILPLSVFIPVYLSIIVSRLADAPVLFASDALPAAIYAAVVLFVYAVLKLSGYRGSLSVPGLAVMFCGLGMMFQMRVGMVVSLERVSFSQWAFPLGACAMLAAFLSGRGGRLRKLEPLWFPIMIASVAIIAFVLIVGRRYRGAVFLPGNVNPVEIVKPMLIVFISSMLAGHSSLLRRGFLGIPLPPVNIVLTIAILWAAPMLMLVLQGDFGMFALMNATLVIMIYAAAGRLLYLAAGLAAIVLLARLAIPMTARGLARWNAWIDPFSVATGAGWQPLQGLVGLYSGGFFGTGVGAGSPTVVPIVESDFIYIVLGEELGIAGCFFVMLFYILFTAQGMRIASRTPDVYESTVATGITSCIALQAVFNIGGVTTAIPLTGIPLPFLSHGGSSLVTTLLMVGMLMAVSDSSESGAGHSGKRKTGGRRRARRGTPAPRRHVKPYDDSAAGSSDGEAAV